MNFIALLAAALAAAGDTVHEVEIRGGVNEVVRADRMLSGTQHHGASPTFDLSWSPRGPRVGHVVELSFTPASLGTGPSWEFTRDGESFETGDDAAFLADLQYAVGGRIETGPWTFHVGGTLANHFENITTNFGFYGMNTYFGVFELAPWADARLRLAERHTLELQGWTPLLAWTARNPYSAHNAEYIYRTRDNNPLNIIPRFIGAGSVQTVNHYQAAHLRLGYAFDLTDTFALVARGRADGLHFSVPHPLVEWQFGMNLGIRGRF